jgi:hypothetical protein
MRKRSSKDRPPSDPNEAAARLVRLATGDEEDTEAPAAPTAAPVKNPAAVALGRLGGRVGGKARAAKLTPEQRSEIARAAAAKRWQNPKR